MLRSALFMLAVFAPFSAHAGHALRVPGDYPDIQSAVNAAADGDTIAVARGQHCGATVQKRVRIVGSRGATIIGCENPAINGTLRLGFFLPDAAASGAQIEGFTFDGQGVSSTNLTPLALGILARHADRVVVTRNRIVGTVQGITNTAGSTWTITGNDIDGFTAFGCDGGLCGGGVGISFTQSDATQPRATGSIIALNRVSGVVPDGLDAFSVAAVFLLGQDGARVIANRVSVPHNPAALGEGLGVSLSDVCCGETTGQTDVNTTIAWNDARGSGVGIYVTRDAAGGYGNLEGARIFANLGTVDLQGGALLDRNSAEARAIAPQNRALIMGQLFR